MGTVTAPAPIREHHEVSRFDSGIESLDAWLRSKARTNEAKGGSRTYVVCDGNQVIGFYSLAASSVERRRVSSRIGRNMPEPIPVILLGQLAVDRRHQGRGLGCDLLQDAAKRALGAADAIGARALIVQALNQEAKRFYESFGFTSFTKEPLMMLLRMSELKAALLHPPSP